MGSFESEPRRFTVRPAPSQAPWGGLWVWLLDSDEESPLDPGQPPVKPGDEEDDETQEVDEDVPKQSPVRKTKPRRRWGPKRRPDGPT